MFTGVHGTTERSTHALRVLTDVALAQGARSLMILSAVDNGDIPALDAFVRGLSVPVFGGLFPGLIEGGELRTSGHVVFGLRPRATVASAQSLSSVEEGRFASMLATVGDEAAQPGTAFVYLSGLSRRIDAALDAVYDACGANRTYIGGGTGSLSDPHAPSVITNAGVLADAVVVALVSDVAAASVGHGWHTHHGPYTATASAATTLRELDFEPASHVYARALGVEVAELAGNQRLLNTHPLGIVTVDGDVIVRDVIDVVDGALVCVGEVPRQARLHILTGDTEGLIVAASDVADGLSVAAGPVVAFDCVSRGAVLAEALPRQYAALRAQLAGRPLAGAQTIGEVASGSGHPPEFHNKTLVLAGGLGRA